MNKCYKKLSIRDAIKEDARQLCIWWNDGKVMAHAGFYDGLHTNRKAIEDSLCQKDNEYRHMICYDHQPIGEMVYRYIGEDICEIGIKICDFTMQNQGYGKIALSLLIEGLFHDLRCKKIVLSTDLKNHRARHVYKCLGFRQVSIKRDIIKDSYGEFHSSVEYELLPEYFVSYIKNQS